MVHLFQFTPLREGRPLTAKPTNYSIGFQFTPLREGRPAYRGETVEYDEPFQFTPLREGRPALLPASLRTVRISIHAPA